MERLKNKLLARVERLERAIDDIDNRSSRYEYIDLWKGELRAYKIILRDIEEGN